MAKQNWKPQARDNSARTPALLSTGIPRGGDSDDLCRLEIAVGFRRDNPNPSPCAETFEAVNRNLTARLIGDRDIAKLRKLKRGAAELAKQIADADARLTAMKSERDAVAAAVDDGWAGKVREANATIKQIEVEQRTHADDLATTNAAIDALAPVVLARIKKAAHQSKYEVMLAMRLQRDETHAFIAGKMGDKFDDLVRFEAAATIAETADTQAVRTMLATLEPSAV